MKPLSSEAICALLRGMNGAVALIVFTWRELVFPDPVVDLSIFKYPMFTVTVVLTVMLSFAQYGANLLNPIFLQEYMGYTAWKAGLALAPDDG